MLSSTAEPLGEFVREAFQEQLDRSR
jgi:hypothetical protein